MVFGRLAPGGRLNRLTTGYMPASTVSFSAETSGTGLYLLRLYSKTGMSIKAT